MRADPELHTVGFASDAAFQRFRESRDDDSWMAELSNMLHHLYRLRVLCKKRLGDFERPIEAQTPALPSAHLEPVYAETYGVRGTGLAAADRVAACPRQTRPVSRLRE